VSSCVKSVIFACILFCHFCRLGRINSWIDPCSPFPFAPRENGIYQAASFVGPLNSLALMRKNLLAAILITCMVNHLLVDKMNENTKKCSSFISSSPIYRVCHLQPTSSVGHVVIFYLFFISSTQTFHIYIYIYIYIYIWNIYIYIWNVCVDEIKNDDMYIYVKYIVILIIYTAVVRDILVIY